MNRITNYLASAFILASASILLSCNTSITPKPVSSPDNNITVDFEISENGQAEYTVDYGETRIIEKSKMGLKTKIYDFSTGMRLVGMRTAIIEDAYTLLSGKKKECLYNANETTYSLENKQGEKLDIVFRVSNDGVAFRYAFPEKDTTIHFVTEETSSFKFNELTKAWLQPLDEKNTGFCGTNPSYEQYYLKDIAVGTACPTKAGWAYPALFKYQDVWALISETGMEKTHCASRLGTDSENGEYKIAFPMEGEVFTGKELLSNSSLPWNLPWRIIALGDLATITASTLGTDLAPPSVINNTDWIIPGKSSWSWVILKDDFTVFPVQKEFVDYASNMGWAYCLVDAYWDQKIGYDKIAELAKYAATKNVGLILWYNSAGDWNTTDMTPRDKMKDSEIRRAEFKKLQAMGIKGVKIDFFGGDGQSMIEYYLDILADAAKYHITVNFHGSTLPRGVQRTYPNNLTNESIKGYEYVTFAQDNMNNLCSHAAMLPFTRNCFDPMDFTPMCFSEVPNINRISSNGFELATAIVFVSGIQHYAETPKSMTTVPAYVNEFIKGIPSIWDDVKLIDAFPGKHVVIARKAGNAWYVAGINGENRDKALVLDLSVLGEFTSTEIITDGETNRSFKQENLNIETLNNLPVTLKGNGGFVIKISK